MTSGTSTPTSSGLDNGRFTTPQLSAEQRATEQTVGLVHLSEFRKRTAQALEGERVEGEPSAKHNGSVTSANPKKKTKKTKKAALSFGDDDEGDSSTATTASTTRSATPADSETSAAQTQKKLSANAGVGFVARSQTKSSLARDAQLKEQLRRTYLAEQARVRATDFLIPFVLSADGKDTPGGRARVKKGDQVWRFLDQAKRIGAEQSGKGLRQWARVSADDLMLVKDGLILPQHLEFYWFMQNRAKGYTSELFPYSSEVTAASPAEVAAEEKLVGGLIIPGQTPAVASQKPAAVPEAELEGFDADPAATKVVLRPWYERNKHIFPMSTWKDFQAEVDYSKEVRKDADGNAFFAST